MSLCERSWLPPAMCWHCRGSDDTGLTVPMNPPWLWGLDSISDVYEGSE